MPRPMGMEPPAGDAKPSTNGNGDTPERASGTPGTSDSSGRALALELPGWDLLPPTEFLQRPGR
jgi:hypothetical protein